MPHVQRLRNVPSGIWLAVYGYAVEEAPQGAAPFGAVCSLFRCYLFVLKMLSGRFRNLGEGGIHNPRKRVLVFFGDDKRIVDGKRYDTPPICFHKNLTADFGVDALKPQADGAVEVGIDVRVPGSDVGNQGFGGIVVAVQVLGDCASCLSEAVCIQERVERLFNDGAAPSGQGVGIALQVMACEAIEKAGMDLLIIQFHCWIPVDSEVLPMRLSAGLPPAAIEAPTAIPCPVVDAVKGSLSGEDGIAVEADRVAVPNCGGNVEADFGLRKAAVDFRQHGAVPSRPVIVPVIDQMPLGVFQSDDLADLVA